MYVNLTPHAIVLNNGTVYPASGTIARVSVEFFGPTLGEGYPPMYRQAFGEVVDLPEPKEETLYIVSAMVLTALNGSRIDVVAPATGHKDCVRNNGHIVSVPGFCYV